MTRNDIITALLAQRPALVSRGVEHLALFGSRARGDGRIDSDLDILIAVAPGRRFSLLDLSGVGLLIEDLVGIRSQIVLERSLPPAFASRIRDDLVEVF